MQYTGFRSFWIYNLIKYIHFNSKKFNIMDGLTKKSVYLKKWNEEMINRRDSLMFKKIDEILEGDQNKLIRLMTTYWIKNNKFYITQIFDDDFQSFKDNEWEITHLKEVLERDYTYILMFAIKNNIPLKTIFKNKKYSVLFKMYEKKKISINSIICFEIAFNFIEKMDISKFNIVQEEKFEFYKKIIDKYTQIIYKYIDFNTKEYLKQTHIKLMEN